MVEELKVDYLFFDNLQLKEIIEKQYNPPYSFKIRLSYNTDNCFITIETDKVHNINELPKNIEELINKYKLIKHVINCYSDNLYLQFNIKLNEFEKNFVIKVDVLKKMIITNKENN